MSAVEEAALTVERLLRKQMHLVLDSGALGSVVVSGEYPNNDALKIGEGQVTVSLAESIDHKLDLTGSVRLQTSALRVNVWATDNFGAAETGKTRRDKINTEVNRIILQNRNSPNVTTYDFYNTTGDSQTSKAFSGSIEAAPTATWNELTPLDYQNLWYSDDSRRQVSQSESGSYAVLLCGFKIESRRAVVQKMVLNFEGYGTSPYGYGVTVKVWNNTESVWQNEQSHTNSTDNTLTITISSDATDFVDANGNVWLLAKTTNPSDGASAAILFCDYTNCTVNVNGVTYCDVASRRNLDRVDIKPPIYRTEFTVKTQLIENIGV